MEVGIPHTLRMNLGRVNPGRSLKRWYFGSNRGSIKLTEKAISGRFRSYATVENRKSKGIESYMGGKTLCLSHFGYTS
jgi:hypothetical protein